MPSKVLIVVLVVQFIFLSICFGPFQSHSNPRLAARPKMTLSWAQNIFIPVRKNRCFITITLKQTNKQTNKQRNAPSPFSMDNVLSEIASRKKFP